MSAKGQKATSGLPEASPICPPKADSGGERSHVCYGYADMSWRVLPQVGRGCSRRSNRGERAKEILTDR